jgi:hypothetical protein
MKKTNIIIVAIIVILLLLGAWFFIFNKKAPETNQQAANPAGSQSQQEPAKPGIKESLLGLLEGAAGVKCTIEDANGKYTVTSKGGKARIDGMSFPNFKNPAVTEAGSMINDGEWAYMWNGKEGMKFNLKEMEQNSGQNQNPQAKTSDWKDWAKGMEASGAKYDCAPTVATDADFTPPTDVKFQDLGEMLKNIQQMQQNPNIPIDPNQFKVPGNY